ncbi:endophilin-B1 [Capsaspora owczarzaki ATCC 30864]|uniref:Endophilin-B1 n=1 Tax=Capsaspora owczarzaki (strain ATCC 30864) TaxID=595528 RepID=A0A0D2WQK2_CAPO3|nr:endophilin-B1 [Capsaspora owczarzaki ATCC 30864]KJE93228.1 endophilin-B1 [Capsaspora owczarzaki ATCC 30864]|eukprot:XP_004347871.1 endophilin-B1 [Capsaspora owczarzaki ATCC 30864]
MSSSTSASASQFASSASETASRFAGLASKTFSRAMQFSQEKMGSAEKTEMDFRFQHLSERADKTKLATDRLIKAVEVYLEPSTGARIQNVVKSKLNHPRTPKETVLEKLGSTMVEAGESLGSDEQYGGALIRAGIVQQHIGEAWAELAAATTSKFLDPKTRFINVDIRELTRLRNQLSKVRLDLDVAKTKVRKAQNGPAEKLAEAENQLRNTQWEFDEQYKQVKAALETVTEEHDRQLIQLVEYVEAQNEYFQNAAKLMGDLTNDLRSIRSGAPASSLAPFAPTATAAPATKPATSPVPTSGLARGPASGRKARVVYDHEANSDSELSVSADDIVTVLGEPLNVNSITMCMCEARGVRGMVPHAFLEYLQ